MSRATLNRVQAARKGTEAAPAVVQHPKAIHENHLWPHWCTCASTDRQSWRSCSPWAVACCALVYFGQRRCLHGCCTAGPQAGQQGGVCWHLSKSEVPRTIGNAKIEFFEVLVHQIRALHADGIVVAAQHLSAPVLKVLQHTLRASDTNFESIGCFPAPTSGLLPRAVQWAQRLRTSYTDAMRISMQV